ncbi:MAG TPA: ROK family protein [Acidimicrobiia bacterium]|nr:ROK family protein [Acidimicrobiia bacterium]
MSTIYLGIDVGGSGIKSALVDVATGELVTERARLDTPQPATPEAVTDALAGMVQSFDYDGPIGVGFPSVIRNGTVDTANNIDPGWIGRKVTDIFEAATGRATTVINDADAAALAEVTFGAAAGVQGMVLMITFGTGIGSGLLVDGQLVPNLELGQIELDGHAPAESYFSAKARRRENLDWDQWGARANRYLRHVDFVFNPDRIVLGGGLTKHWEFFQHALDDALPVVPATMGNSAGLVGAALVASGSRTP